MKFKDAVLQAEGWKESPTQSLQMRKLVVKYIGVELFQASDVHPTWHMPRTHSSSQQLPTFRCRLRFNGSVFLVAFLGTNPPWRRLKKQKKRVTKRRGNKGSQELYWKLWECVARRAGRRTYFELIRCGQDHSWSNSWQAYVQYPRSMHNLFRDAHTL